ncbi:MAG: DUF1998 domain-containing protein [Micromonosporaceae bacterium]|nr:DUF1998 domain-containing protein [Micromonosporaceae bacterium]
MNEAYRRRVGTARPSHLMFTGGVGGLIDLPNFTVLVRGVDDWSYQAVPSWQPIHEPRLLAAVRDVYRQPGVVELRAAPWLEETPGDPSDLALRIGVPVTPFPQWLRCTACNTLAALDSKTFGFINAKARRPDEARFFHPCRGNKKRLAVPARFLLACTNGHLDDFPYVEFVHHGAPCAKATHPTLRMDDHGGNLGANVKITCTNCQMHRNIREALGAAGERNLPLCRGRHPHLGVFRPCEQTPKVLVVGASNQWFAETLTVLAVPPTGASALRAKVVEMWDGALAGVTGPEVLAFALTQPNFTSLRAWPAAQVWEAIAAHRASLAADGHADAFAAGQARPDLLMPEWEVFTTKPVPEPMPDFTLRDDGGVPAGLQTALADVVQVERLRMVRALVGFTRLDAPDPADPDLVERAPISREATPPWVPASEIRGEGLFLRVRDDLIAAWEERVTASATIAAHADAYARYRRNRYSERIKGPFDPMRHWPGARYIALHTLSHLLIRAIALECGYSSASLAERVYAGTDDDPRAGILIYTAVPDAEGTLGGLVALGEPDALTRVTDCALRDAMSCSSDPLCAERLPGQSDDFLHGAACHVCLFVSETTCERGNRFLDRRLVVPVGDPDLALLRDLPTFAGTPSAASAAGSTPSSMLSATAGTAR